MDSLLKKCLSIIALSSAISGIATAGHAQKQKDRWQRVYTGDDFSIDIDSRSVTLEPERVFRATFRTVWSTPATLNDKQKTRYQTRLEVIESKLNEQLYRLLTVWLLDSNNNTVQSFDFAPTAEWKLVKVGGMMQRQLSAAKSLLPFGDWKVSDFRMAEGAKTDAPDLRRLIGARVSLSSETAMVASNTCSSPTYDSERLSKDELARQLGIEPSKIGIKTDEVQTVVIKCASTEWTPPQSLLVVLPDNGFLMLWKGVFLVLRKH